MECALHYCCPYACRMLQNTTFVVGEGTDGYRSNMYRTSSNCVVIPLGLPIMSLWPSLFLTPVLLSLFTPNPVFFISCFSAEHSSSNSSRASPASRIVRFNNNPLFRAVSDRSMFRSGWGGGGAAGAATVQSVAQAQGVAGEWGGVNGQAAGSAGGGETVDDSDSARAEGRILFYHKPTLANVPAGDVPDVVPVYLGCPGGGMALGLPLNEAWQGGDQQVGNDAVLRLRRHWRRQGCVCQRRVLSRFCRSLCG